MRLVTCKVCGEKFVKQRIGQKTCSVKCAIEYARKDTEKKAKAAARLDRKVTKEKLKTRQDWIREAQAAFNKYVRIRDHGLPCISCGSMPDQKYGGTMDCSHYRSVGAAPHLRFNLHNVAAGCVKCNRYLSGNVVELRRGLIKRIGINKVEELESNNKIAKFDIQYLERIKKIFSRKANNLARIKKVIGDKEK